MKTNINPTLALEGYEPEWENVFRTPDHFELFLKEHFSCYFQRKSWFETVAIVSNDGMLLERDLGFILNLHSLSYPIRTFRHFRRARVTL